MLRPSFWLEYPNEHRLSVVLSSHVEFVSGSKQFIRRQSQWQWYQVLQSTLLMSTPVNGLRVDPLVESYGVSIGTLFPVDSLYDLFVFHIRLLRP